MNERQVNYYREIVETGWLMTTVDKIFRLIARNYHVEKEFVARGEDICPQMIRIYDKWRTGGGEQKALEDDDLRPLALWLLRGRNVEKFDVWVEDIDASMCNPISLLFFTFDEKERLMDSLRWLLGCGKDLESMKD